MKQWYNQLDGLRFVAVSLVMVEHFAFFIGKHIHAGYTGVDLFFVLSGFLITEGLLRDTSSGKSNKTIIKHFYIKRSLRIFPIYYITLILALLFFDQFKPLAPYAFTYTINYYHVITGVVDRSSFSHLWSLSLEEQFYMFWPCVIIFIRSQKALLITIVLILIGSLAFFLYTNNYQMLPARMFSLCFGAVLAYVKKFHSDYYQKEILKKALILGISGVLVYVFVKAAVGISMVSTMLVYIGTNNAFTGVLRRFFEHKKIMYIGKISYGIYLYHKPLAFVLTYYMFDPIWFSLDFSFFPQLEYHSWIIKLPLFYLAAIGVSHLSFQYLERPILKYKAKLTEGKT